MKKNIPEILAPAGNTEMALAAYAAGADAVYLGCGNFNARRRAANFTTYELGALVNHAHKLGKKTYVTVNTLVKENELHDVAVLLADIVSTNADAIIVQDTGVLNIARKCFPMLECHASTQMGIHNVSGIMQAAAWGVKRVILERQITLPEIKLCAEAAAKAGIDLEVFIHGSMCASLSGRCLWSSALGGESGNRGCCKQPCRREYLLKNRTGKGEIAGHWLSMHDMAGTSFMEEMIALGIRSFKIEGRLRSPDYVVKAVTAYSMLRNAVSGTGSEQEKSEAFAEVESILERTPARFPGPGPVLEKNDKWLIPFEAAAFGNAAGEVKAVARNGIAVRLSARIHLGDRLRLIPPTGGEGEAFTLTRLCRRGKNGDEDIKAASAGDVFIPGNFRNICQKGSLLRKIGESNSAFRRRAATLPEWKTDLRAELSCTAANVELSIPERGISISRPHGGTPARQHSLSVDSLMTVFAAGSPAGWNIIPVPGSFVEGIFIPASVLKQLRRDIYAELAQLLADSPRSIAAADGLKKFEETFRRSQTKPVNRAFRHPDYSIPAFIPAGQEADKLRELETFLRQHPSAAVAASSWGGIYWLSMLRSVFPEAEFMVRPPAPLTNSAAIDLLAEAGINCCESWQELEAEAHNAIAENSLLPVRRAVKIPPLLVTRAKLSSGVITDREGRRFRIAPVPGEPLNGVYAMDDNPVNVWVGSVLK